MMKHTGIKSALFILMMCCLCSPLLVVKAQTSGWSKLPTPTEKTLTSVYMVSSTDGWVVGELGTIFRWDGSNWNAVSIPTNESLRSVFMVSSNDGWIVGDYGTILRWDGSNWNPINSGTNAHLMSVCWISATDIWAVGFTVTARGVILHWDGVQWNTEDSSPVTLFLWSVFGTRANDVWVVGLGTTLKWDGINWKNVTNPATNHLVSVFGTSANDVWVVGYDGTILRWDGSNWNPVSSPTEEVLTSVYMVSSTEGLAVGVGGTILRWDGSNWNPVSSPTSAALNSVFMLSSDEAWAVGVGGTILHFKEPEKEAPIASFTYSPLDPEVNEEITFDASGSSDSDGTIVDYAWDFGDGATGTGRTSSHSYSSADTYTVELTVTDNDDLTDTATKTITVTPHEIEPQAPSASFISSPSSPEIGETVTFDASGSSDPDGTIVDYEWNFGDGSTGTGETASHAYSSAGTYTVTLTVTDNDGLTATTTRTITVPPPGLKAPSASFTSSPPSPEVGETVTFDASGSSDADGSIVSYDWDFGDGNTGAGITATHSYGSEDTYTVTLTVTDNDGFTDTATKTITVRPIGSEIDDEAPVADAGNDRNVNAGSKVTFSAAGSTDNVGIASYAWDFGDGNSGIGETVSYTYGDVGNYTVTLTVVDAAGNFDTDTILVTVKEEAPDGFPFWILIPIMAAIVVVVLMWFFFFRKKKPEKKEPKPVKVRVTAEPSELLADGKTKSAITVELLDADGNPVPAPDNTEIKLTTTKGRIEHPVVKISKGKDKEQTLLFSPKEGGKATLSANVGDLGSTSVTVTFLEKARYCMHCGSKMSFAAKNCPVCGKSPPAGVDTRSCKKCNAVIPGVANFCAECGARQLK